VDPLQPNPLSKPDAVPLVADVAAYIAGDEEAGGRICEALGPVVRNEVRRFLPDTDAEHDDVVQETLLGFLTYLGKAKQAPGSLEAFVVTMAGNRCRNLYRWRQRRPGVDMASLSDGLKSQDADPLELIEKREVEKLVRDALDRLEPRCRKLLLEIYVEQRSMQEVRKESGLGTVQGAYYRKYVCLRKLSLLLNRAWFEGRESGSPPDEAGGARP
jgi:RNA polymerase sigma-70 factor (ECF subfamily)